MYCSRRHLIKNGTSSLLIGLIAVASGRHHSYRCNDGFIDINWHIGLSGHHIRHIGDIRLLRRLRHLRRTLELNQAKLLDGTLFEKTKGFEYKNVL